MAALFETRLPDSGSIQESIYTIFWHGKLQGCWFCHMQREQGVGFAIRNSIIPFCETPVGISTRLTTLRVHTIKGPLTIFSIYMHLLSRALHKTLEQEIKKFPRTETVIMLGNFNARVGRAFESWNGILGKNDVGNMNENGQPLLELCASHNLCVTITFFEGKL